jgi:precorrin-2 dehydrogenase/sirohydrochlorin ferrochelatase
MQKFYYPLFLDIEGKKCVVIGGGEVATRKVKALLTCRADVVVISPEIEDELKRLNISWIKREYRYGDLDGAQIVISATDSPEVNKKVSEEAREKNILVNVVDNPKLCNFLVPSTLRRGELCIAISTSGRAPSLAKAIRIRLEKIFGPEYESKVEEWAR